MNSLESFTHLLIIPCSLLDKFMEICHSNGPRGKRRWSERSDQSAEPKASDCPMKNKNPQQPQPILKMPTVPFTHKLKNKISE